MVKQFKFRGHLISAKKVVNLISQILTRNFIV